MSNTTVKEIGLFTGGHAGGRLIYMIAEGEEKIFNNQIQKTNKCPITVVMEELVDKLRIHALRICEIFPRSGDSFYDFEKNQIASTTEADVKNILQNKLDNCWISSIKTPDNGFGLAFEYRRFDKDVHMKFFTEIIDAESGYDYFEEVMSIIEQISEEAFKWINFESVIDSQHILRNAAIVKYKAHTAAELDEILSEMSDEERIEVQSAFLERQGIMVVKPADALAELEAEEEEVSMEALPELDEKEVDQVEDTDDIPNIEEDVEQSPFDEEKPAFEEKPKTKSKKKKEEEEEVVSAEEAMIAEQEAEEESINEVEDDLDEEIIPQLYSDDDVD